MARRRLPRVIDDPRTLLDLPYGRRQLIAIDSPYRRTPRASNNGRLRDIADRAASTARRAQRSLRERRNRRIAAQGLQVLRVDIAMATEHLSFPPGHPLDGIVYVADPALTGTYYPAATFHRRTFDRKFSEAVRLLMALGATSIEVLHRQGWGRQFAGSLGASSLFSGATGSRERASDRESKVLFRAELTPSAPFVPDDLHWLKHEPNWQALVEGRLHRGLRDFTLHLQYHDAFRVDSSLEGKIKALGFQAGGEIEEFQQTEWEMRGEFAVIELTNPHDTA